jgi:CRP-like cAMP-binding protein
MSAYRLASDLASRAYLVCFVPQADSRIVVVRCFLLAHLNKSCRVISRNPSVVLLMANFGKEGKPEPVIAKISQETLAEMIGTTRSRVSAFMNKFRKLGFIEYNGDLKVHNSLLNVILHDAPGLRRETEDA